MIKKVPLFARNLNMVVLTYHCIFSAVNNRPQIARLISEETIPLLSKLIKIYERIFGSSHLTRCRLCLFCQWRHKT